MAAIICRISISPSLLFPDGLVVLPDMRAVERVVKYPLTEDLWDALVGRTR